MLRISRFEFMVMLPLLVAGTAFATGDPSPLVPQQMVDAHNVWRSAVGSPPLEWADDLAAGAEQWAKHLASEKACRMEHSSAEARQWHLPIARLSKVTEEILYVRR